MEYNVTDKRLEAALHSSDNATSSKIHCYAKNASNYIYSSVTIFITG